MAHILKWTCLGIDRSDQENPSLRTYLVEAENAAAAAQEAIDGFKADVYCETDGDEPIERGKQINDRVQRFTVTHVFAGHHDNAFL